VRGDTMSIFMRTEEEKMQCRQNKMSLFAAASSAR
jgi:hypothetical protein